MRTSNKILTALLLLVFLAPLLIALDLKNKLGSKEYSLDNRKENGSDYGSLRQGTLQPYKVVKITGPFFQKVEGTPGELPAIFTCHLRPSATAAYSYGNFGGLRDSLRIYNSGDTLFIKYVNGKDEDTPGAVDANSAHYSNTTYYFNLEATVSLPNWDHLEIEGATVLIDSLPLSAPSMSVSLRNFGHLKLGYFGSKTDSGGVTTFMSCHTKDLTLHVFDAEVSMGAYFKADHLNLQMNGHSTIEIKDASINKLDGSLSDDTKVNANWNYIRRLALLTGK